MSTSITYLGLNLSSPLLLGSSPLTRHLEPVLALARTGLGAVVVHSLFEEAILQADQGADGSTAPIDAEPSWPSPDAHLAQVRRLVQALKIPVIASLNGRHAGGWVRYARLLQDTGAAALELNLYYLNAHLDLDSQTIESDLVRLVADVRAAISIPLAVKLGPYFTGLPAFCRRLTDAGANGLVLFNRFYQSDLDMEALQVVPTLRLSNSEDLLHPLRWTAILSRRVAADISLSGGIHTSNDLIKALAAGATTVQATASLLRHGPAHATTLLAGLSAWMAEHHYTSIAELRGRLAENSAVDPTNFERASYIQSLRTWDLRSMS